MIPQKCAKTQRATLPVVTEVPPKEPAGCPSTCVDDWLSTKVDIAAPQRQLGAI
jgi:hypothetical protein